ncbi:hypothetical protein QOZ80_8BG0667760 [Eleusine coracana subsp. coracana]|nr:hypothetical protein QOZ80_8BG0667760 [Eleusine coracana subsp. coracana]
MAEALLLSVMRGVVGKAGDVLVQRVTRMWGVDGDREKMEDRLVYVSRMLVDAEVKAETDPAVKRWMKNLKAVAYQADDILDNFQYEALHREAQGPRSMTSKVLSNFTHHSPLLFRLKISWELKNVLDKLEGLVSDMNQFGLLERAEVPQVVNRQKHSALDKHEEIFGRNNDKEMIVKLLLDHQDQQSVQVLPIIGMGGLGKTTLAKLVYNDSRVKKHFELKMWCCVSENFEATAIVRSVIELATKGTCDLRDNIELLKGRLQEVIGRKRFLLILDDVWNNEQHKWEEDLKPLLCSCIGGSGSTIVVTSRLQHVASIMGTLPSYELKILSEEDSWKLFSKKAFINKGLQEQTELFPVGKRIVDKCKGLPLALKTMGGLMSSKQQVQEWKAIAHCSISDTSRGKHEVLSILKLSYTHLSSEMKQCFAFCAIFPKDYEMEKNMLIQLWMANGFILEEGAMDLTDKGEFIFNELAWRSFLQDISVKQYVCSEIYYEEMECKMHDLMHDLAISVTEECAPSLYLSQRNVSLKNVQHMHVSRDEFKEIGGLLKDTSCLRTLLTQSDHNDLNELKLKSLRTLCFQCSSSTIHSQLINTKHLRYLDISRSDIVKLPESICSLYNLQSLRLNFCRRLEYLPESMAKMNKLSHVYLLGTYNLKWMPPNLSLLHNLRTLTQFVVHTRNGCGIEELKDMRQLGNMLQLFNLQKVKTGSKVNLHDKQNLSKLYLSTVMYIMQMIRLVITKNKF